MAKYLLKCQKLVFICYLLVKLLRKLKKRIENFPAGYVGSFYQNLADSVDIFMGSDFYGRIVSNSNIPSEDIQKYILATSDFAKGMQTDINHYVAKDRINNASFRQKLNPISKNIIRRQNPLDLVFEDISTFDVENPIVGFLLKELDVDKKDIASELIKKAHRPSIFHNYLKNRLNKLKDRPEPKDENDDNLSPWPPPPSFPPPPPPLPPPLGRPLPPPPFSPPSSGKFLESLPKNEPPFRSNNFIPIPPAPSAPPLSPDDFYLVEPTSPTPSNNLYGSQVLTLCREQGK